MMDGAARHAKTVACFLLVQCTRSEFIVSKVGHDATSAQLEVQGVGAGPFHPSRIRNWVHDVRAPLIAPRPGGSCPGNIYAANAVNNGGAVNIFFGGWDGVSSCHDSISVAVTMDNFASINQHYTAIATGAEMHVNNPSAIKSPNGHWAMLYTQLPTDKPLNKPGFSTSTDGVRWTPGEGGKSQDVHVSGFAAWKDADVNGGNVLVYEDGPPAAYHMYFIDFKEESMHSVFHAKAPVPATGSTSSLEFEYMGVALAEPRRIVNDVKKINGHYVMALHMNGQHTFVSVVPNVTSPPRVWPTSSSLFGHLGAADNYIVSVGLVTDAKSERLMGALYGAGADPALDQNRVFAAWLQRRMLFKSLDNSTVWGVGDAARARGADTVLLGTNAPTLKGRWFLYDADFSDAANYGTLLFVSGVVDVAPGDVWRVHE